MTLRSRLFKYFGGFVIEAIVICIVREFNRNRAWHGKPLIDKDMVEAEMMNDMTHLEPYE